MRTVIVLLMRMGTPRLSALWRYREPWARMHAYVSSSTSALLTLATARRWDRCYLGNELLP